MTDSPYTVIIGLELHVQLLAESKMFCGCGTKFGDSPTGTLCSRRSAGHGWYLGAA
jgi:aspartyl-tRNA(Asn)/glutamyl-tRNA(Gln) amidotransferase subunit B